MAVGFCVITVLIRLLLTVLLLTIVRKLEVEEFYVMLIHLRLLLIAQFLVIVLREGEEAMFKTALLQLLSTLFFGQIALRKFILG